MIYAVLLVMIVAELVGLYAIVAWVADRIEAWRYGGWR